jgi:glycosyltransferase involved in cell wall biosynthesis
MLRVLTLSTLFPNGRQPNLGGFVERQTLGLAARDDVEVQVVAPVGLPPGPLALHPRYRRLAELPLKEDRNGLRVHRPRFALLPLFGARWSAKWLARAIEPTLREIRREFPFDVIDAEFFWPDGPAAMRVGRALGVPFSVKARGSDIQYWMRRADIANQILEASRAAGGMLAVSEALKRVMIGHGMPGERIRTHYTGVDHQRFRPADRAEAKAKLGVSGPMILTVGALIPGKGQRLAISALEQVPGATLLLAGEGPDRRALEALVRRRGVGKRVRLLGNVPHEEVATLLAAADLMVLPSNSEGLANVWIEALACGTPVVTCDVGGAREVIDRPEAGAIVPPDPAAIAQAVTLLLAHPPAQADVRKAAQRFSWDENSARLAQHLSAIAGGRIS